MTSNGTLVRGFRGLDAASYRVTAATSIVRCSPQEIASGCALAPTPTNQGAAGLALAGAPALLAVARRPR